MKRITCLLATIGCLLTGLAAGPDQSGRKTYAPVPLLSNETCDSGCYATTSYFRTEARTDITTRLIDWDADRAVVLKVDKFQKPIDAVIGENYFSILEGRLDDAPHRFYHKIMYALPIAACHNLKSDGCPDKSDYHLPVADVLQCEPIKAFSTDRLTYSEAILQPSNRIIVWRRPPVEHAFFGHPVRAMIISSKHGYKHLMFNAQATKTGTGRLDRQQAQQVSRELAERVAASKNGDADGDEADALMSLERLFLDRRNDWTAALSTHYQFMLGRHALEEEKQIAREEVTKRRLYAVAIMLETIEKMDEVFRQGDVLILDPFARGLFLEQRLWKHNELELPVAGQLMTIIDGLHERGDEMRFTLMSYFADLGFMPNAYCYDVLGACLTGKYEDHIAATVLARWNWPTEPRHAHAVLKFLDETPLRAEKLDAIETLILLGSFDDVPESLREDWFSTRVVDGDKSRRSRCLSYLFRDDQGRDYLVAKHQALPDGSELKSAIGELFRAEIETTRRFAQFDYLSDRDCVRFEDQLKIPSVRSARLDR